MLFRAEPNLYVKISNKFIQRATGKKGFYFSDKGEYETDSETLIKALSQTFEIVKEENNAPGDGIKCKKCGMAARNKGELLAHYRNEHKKEVG